MERTEDEAEYVLAVLRRMRNTVNANPEWFEPNAQTRIDEAIICIQNVIRSTPSELTICSVEQDIKAA
jgi:hypothetical protein